MKSVLSFLVTVAIVVSFAGCYTELATNERQDTVYADDADTSYENGSTTINNHYYLDDNYRHSRLRVSFNYYYPTYSSWIGSYYYSYFDDPYWGMYHRPSWYYDPFYSYYPPYGGCYYPSPYYDPWYSYYPPVGYYSGYYPSPIYANQPSAPNRTRNDGTTRDPRSDDRSRPLPSTLPATEPPVVGTSTENRPRGPVEALPVRSPETRRTPERPWWEKMNTDRPTRIADEGRPTETIKGNRPPRENNPAYNPPVNDRPNPTTDGRPINRPKDNQPNYTPSKNNHPSSDARPVERPKRGEQGYLPPAKHSVPKNEARPVERSRETRQPSYAPPHQSAPPQSAPARSGGGGSSSGESGRKRD